MKKVSVVIPAYNEESYIGRCLQSLVDQETNFEYEVILVDNNSEDNTVEVASTFEGKLNLKIFKESKVGRGAARARGFREASGQIILSTDADTILPKNWIEILAKPIEEGAIATTTSCKIEDGSRLSCTIFNFTQPQVMVLYRIIFGHFWLSGFSFGILKSVYERSGGFDPQIQAQEDIDLSFKVAKSGKVKFINKPVISSGRRFKQGMIPGFYQYLKSFTQLLLAKKKDSYLSNVR